MPCSRWKFSSILSILTHSHFIRLRNRFLLVQFTPLSISCKFSLSLPLQLSFTCPPPSSLLHLHSIYLSLYFLYPVPQIECFVERTLFLSLCVCKRGKFESTNTHKTVIQQWWLYHSWRQQLTSEFSLDSGVCCACVVCARALDIWKHFPNKPTRHMQILSRLRYTSHTYCKLKKNLLLPCVYFTIFGWESTFTWYTFTMYLHIRKRARPNHFSCKQLIFVVCTAVLYCLRSHM